MNKEQALLEVKGLKKSFGGIQALGGVELALYERELVAVIGPNGAGKTTFFNCLTGMIPPDAGGVHVFHQGRKKNLMGLKPDQITHLGLARTFQNIRLFDQLSVIENVLIGCHPWLTTNFIDAIIRSKRHQREEQEAKAKCFAILEVLQIQHLAQKPAGSLAYADMRRLEIARALATKPNILLLDEPAAGMNHKETAELDDLLLQLRHEFGVAILLIEHDMKLVMKISDRVMVMDRGISIAQGTPAEVRNNKDVIAAYLGTEVSHA